MVLLSLAIALAQFSTLAMKEDAGELMASFAPIELDEDASATVRFTLREGFGQRYAVKRREIVIRGIEHKRVQLAAANSHIASDEERQRYSVLKQTGER